MSPERTLPGAARFARFIEFNLSDVKRAGLSGGETRECVLYSHSFRRYRSTAERETVLFTVDDAGPSEFSWTVL